MFIMDKIFLLDGITFKKMLLSGYESLEHDYKLINDLNVFPVPDGDTGTNMKVTYYSGLLSIKEETELGKVAALFARGSLFGARGNSGVLLSQYFKGMSNALAGEVKINANHFARALIDGYKLAYKCAINPVEGTILTVAREGIENVKNQIDDNTDFGTLFEKMKNSMIVSLENTPNLLAVLKESGVVDSGGRGLLSIFNGFVNFFTGKESTMNIDYLKEDEHHDMNSNDVDLSAFNENSTLDYGYCTEFLLQLLTSKIDIPSFDVNKFINDISELGDSLVVTMEGSIVKVHIHTKTPSNVLSFAQKYGEFLKLKIENMALQHNEIIKQKERRKTAIISIALGDGIINTFKELGSTLVLNGGQTMNTSTEEIVYAIKEANADNVILLPNNSNILLACKQAKELVDNVNVYIVETKTIQEGYYGLSMMMGSEDDPKVLVEQINNGKDLMKSAFVAKAIRDYKYQDVSGHTGDYVGYFDKEIVCNSNDLLECANKLIDSIEDIEDKEVMFIFYGESVSDENANLLKEQLEEKYPYLEIGLIDGDQPVYDLLIGVNI